jgi:hypothetical protein
MPTAEVTARYEFEETGVGCTEHSDPDCLCDVDLTRYPVTPISYPLGAVLYSRLAADLCESEFDKITFEGWAGWLCAITDEAARVKVDGLVKVLAEFREAEQQGATYGGDQRTFHQKAYATLLSSGYNTTQAAQILATVPEELYKLLGRPGKPTGIALLGLDDFLILEAMIQDGSLSVAEMAKELGASPSVVRAHAIRMNAAPPPGVKGKAQLPEVTDCINKHNDEGMSCRRVVAKVLEETGVKVSTTYVLRLKQGS